MSPLACEEIVKSYDRELFPGPPMSRREKREIRALAKRVSKLMRALDEFTGTVDERIAQVQKRRKSP